MRVLGPGVLGHPPARKARRRVHKVPGPQNASLSMCVISTKSGPRIFFYLKKSCGSILWAEEEKA